MTGFFYASELYFKASTKGGYIIKNHIVDNLLFICLFT